MTHPQNNTHTGRHLQTAIEHAGRLAGPGVTQPVTPAWSAQAAHVGDMSVLLLALRTN
jgi:hypothetical protein